MEEETTTKAIVKAILGRTGNLIFALRFIIK